MTNKITEISEKSRQFFNTLEGLISGIYQTVKTARTEDQSFPSDKEKFAEWAQTIMDKAKGKMEEGQPGLVASFKDLLVTLGVSETTFNEVFVRNKKEASESLFGETVAVLALILSWSENDKEEFSKTIGQIGAGSVFALNPVTGIIALVGIALGYQKLYNPDAMKKGFLAGFVGISVSSIVPGGFIVSMVSALVAVIIVNRQLDINRPLEDQIMEYYKKFNVENVTEKLKAFYKESSFGKTNT